MKRISPVFRVAFACGAAIVTAQLLASPRQVPPAAAPPAPSVPTGTGLILGTVVDAGTNKGVPGAVVSYSAAPASATSAPVGLGRDQILTDDGGRFVLRDLPPGRYTLNVQAQGYATGGYGSRRPNGPGQLFELADAEKVRDVTLRIWKFGSIGGRVVDDAGEPVVQATVSVYARELVAGRTRFESVQASRTDDHGRYRMSRLVPGDYLVGIVTSVSTMPASAKASYDSLTGQARSDLLNQLGGNNAMELVLGLGGNTYRIGDHLVQASSNGFTLPPPTSDGRLFVYQTTFHPAAASARAATAIAIGSGEDRGGVNLTMRLVPGVSVSGTLTGPEGPAANSSLALVAATDRDVMINGAIDVASTATDAAGRFTFLGVPAGAYVFEATRVPRSPSTMTSTSVTVETPSGTRTMSTSRSSGPPRLPTEPTYFASRALAIGEASLANIDLQFRIAGRMTGRVEFDGTRERPSADLMAQFPIRLELTDGRILSPVPRAQADATGSFVTTSILPGQYVLYVPVVLAGWTARSAVWRGQDLLDKPFDADGSDIADVVITFSDRMSQLTGVVHDAQGRADATATVVFFTTDRARWTDRGRSSRLVKSARVTMKGGFTISGIPPGDYHIVAVDDASIGDWEDPKRLDALARAGTRITIGDGEQRTIDLKTAVVR